MLIDPRKRGPITGRGTSLVAVGALAAFVAVLAHAGGAEVGGAARIAMTVVIVAALAATWIALGVVCWIFWRAKKREEAEERLTGAGWRSEPSS